MDTKRKKFQRVTNKQLPKLACMRDRTWNCAHCGYLIYDEKFKYHMFHHINHSVIEYSDDQFTNDELNFLESIRHDPFETQTHRAIPFCSFNCVLSFFDLRYPRERDVADMTEGVATVEAMEKAFKKMYAIKNLPKRAPPRKLLRYFGGAKYRSYGSYRHNMVCPPLQPPSKKHKEELLAKKEDMYTSEVLKQRLKLQKLLAEKGEDFIFQDCENLQDELNQ